MPRFPKPGKLLGFARHSRLPAPLDPGPGSIKNVRPSALIKILAPEPVSRILYAAEAGPRPFICPARMRNPFEKGATYPGHKKRAALPPILSCVGLGLPCPPDCSERRWALTPPFQPYLPSPNRSPERDLPAEALAKVGGVFSVALSIDSP